MYQNTKSATTAGLLGIFLGAFGAHNWYLGEKGKGIAHVCMMSAGILVEILAAIVLPNVLSITMLFQMAWLFALLTGVAGIAMSASAIWGLVEGITILVQGDAGLAQKGYAVASPAPGYNQQMNNGYGPMNNMGWNNNGMNGNMNNMGGNMNGGMNNMGGNMNGGMNNMGSNMNGGMNNMNGSMGGMMNNMSGGMGNGSPMDNMGWNNNMGNNGMNNTGNMNNDGNSMNSNNFSNNNGGNVLNNMNGGDNQDMGQNSIGGNN